MTLTGSMCVKEEKEEAMHERTCPSGYTLVNYGTCINTKKTMPKIDGYVCEAKNSKIKESTCIIYEMVEAKQ
ncbi:MAG: hypothetical protein II576_06700 [Prevotella sp.]|nr:hypothetical protein [Prevotella sp.]